jgi:hypothetical protein
MMCIHAADSRITAFAADVVVVAGVVDVPVFDGDGAGVIDDAGVVLVLVDVDDAKRDSVLFVVAPLIVFEVAVLVDVLVLVLVLVVVAGGDEGVPVNTNPLPIVLGNWQLEDAGAGWAAGVEGWPW